MKLSTQTHFSQGWNTSLLKDITSLGTDMIRDAVPWNFVEKRPGEYNFDHPAANWVDKALAAGIEVVLVFNPTSPLYDGGNSIYTDEGRAAFAKYIVATLKAFPGVSAIEIGNEYNTNAFVSGPVANASKDQRDEYYAKIVAAVDKALTVAKIDVDVIGASTHSVPVDYFADLDKSGALDHVDAVSIHPYSSEPEQLAAQLELLRARIGEDTEIHVTEFGDNFATLEDAPAFLAKMVAVMAEAGVASANWYAFSRQSFFPNMELWNPKTDKPTPAGITFGLMEDLLADGDAVTRVELGSHTYFYTFGSDAAILWGEPRGLTLGAGVTAYDLAGRKLADLTGLSPETPVILRTTSGDIADLVSFAESPLLADSYHDFSLTGTDTPWSYFAENGKGKEFALVTLGGGHKAGEPWNPYLGLESLRPFQISSDTLTPVDFAGKKDNDAKEFATVERYTAAEAGKVAIRGHWDVSDASEDGVLLTIEINGKAIFSKVIFDKKNGNVFDLELDGIMLRAGDTIDFEVSTRDNARGDITDRRIQIFDQELLDQLGFDAGTPALDPEDTPADPAPSDDTTPVRQKGSQANDVLLGGAGDDKLWGAGGNDTLLGGDGADQLDGDNGDDTINGGAGKDRLTGGSGADVFVFEGEFGTDTITDFGAGDRIDLSAFDDIAGFSDLDITYSAKRAVIAIGDERIVLNDVTAAVLGADDFIF